MDAEALAPCRPRGPTRGWPGSSAPCLASKPQAQGCPQAAPAARSMSPLSGHPGVLRRVAHAPEPCTANVRSGEKVLVRTIAPIGHGADRSSPAERCKAHSKRTRDFHERCCGTWPQWRRTKAKPTSREQRPSPCWQYDDWAGVSLGGDLRSRASNPIKCRRKTSIDQIVQFIDIRFLGNQGGTDSEPAGIHADD